MRQFLPLLTSTIGVGGTLGFTLLMNDIPPAKEKRQSRSATSFQVAPPPPPPPPKSVSRPKPQKAHVPPPPMPMMNSSLAGMSFGMDALEQEFSFGDDLIVDQGNVVMTSKTVDVPPRPIQRTTPKYPRNARKKGVEGYVTLSLLINEGGKVQDVMIVESHPPSYFDDAAQKAVQSWVFRPGSYKGKNVSVRVTQTLRFDLG